MEWKKYLKSAFLTINVCLLMAACSTANVTHLKTEYLGIDVNEKGYIVGMWNTTRSDSRNFSPNGRPSPLLERIP